MTFQTFKHRVLAIAIFMTASVSIFAQDASLESLIGQSLLKIQPSEPETFLNCIAEMKRIEAMFPDSIEPKYQTVLQSLNYSVMYPQSKQTENVMAEAEQIISKMEQAGNADPSDLCTLRGFYYMVRIVQNPAQNGQRYYMDVMENFDKALKINPENQLAIELHKKFFEGMRQATE